MTKHKKYMKVALQEANRALAAGEFPVGCVMVHKNEIVSRGRRVNSKPPNENELDHAEIMALRELFANHPEINRADITVYSTLEPCLMCFATLLLNGIRKIVYAYEDFMGGGTGLALKKLPPLYNEMQITVTPHIMRQESLELFRIFFSDPNNTYWQDSPLERYTLSQIKAENTR
jgi:tRNA(adenine34) deaminase